MRSNVWPRESLVEWYAWVEKKQSMESQQRHVFPSSLLGAQCGGNLKHFPATSPSDVRPIITLTPNPFTVVSY